MNLGAIAGAAAAGLMAGKKLNKPGPQKPDGRMPPAPEGVTYPDTQSNQMLADGGMVGAVPALNNTHCTGAAYDQGGRDAGKKR